MRKIFLLFGALLLFKCGTYANHMIGINLTYKQVGKDSFMVYADAYKDCKGISMSPVQINIYGIGNSYTANYTMTQVSCKNATGLCASQCTKCAPNNCNAYGYPNGAIPNCAFPYGIEQITFSTLVSFKGVNPNYCKFRISAEQCCRNGQITTCCANDNFFTFLAMDRCIGNSSPQWNEEPEFLCVLGDPALKDFSCTDPDGDSVSYHLTEALATIGTPATYGGVHTFNKPLTFKGFPKTTPTAGSYWSGFVLDSISGELRFIPTQQQISVVVVEAREWRKINGKMKQIGVIRRDQQYIMFTGGAGAKINYPPMIIKDSTFYICQGDSFCFDITSYDKDSADSTFLFFQKPVKGMNLTNSFPNGSTKSTGKLCWNATNMKGQEFYATVVVKDNACPLPRKAYGSYKFVVIDTGSVGGILVENRHCHNTLLSVNTPKKTNYRWTIRNSSGAGVDSSVEESFSLNLKDSGLYYIHLRTGMPNCQRDFYDTIYLPNKTLSISSIGIYDTIKCTAKGLAGQHALQPAIVSGGQ